MFIYPYVGYIDISHIGIYKLYDFEKVHAQPMEVYTHLHSDYTYPHIRYFSVQGYVISPIGLQLSLMSIEYPLQDHIYPPGGFRISVIGIYISLKIYKKAKKIIFFKNMYHHICKLYISHLGSNISHLGLYISHIGIYMDL